MALDDVRSLYRYDEWANARFFRAAEGLDAERLTRRVESSFPSVLATLGHIVGAEWVWLRRWRGESPTVFPGWLESPTLEELRTRLDRVEEERWRYLDDLGEEDLERPLSYRTLSGDAFTNRLLDLLLHVVNHSSYHRGQMTTMLRQVDAETVATDYVLFKRLESSSSGSPSAR